MPLAKPQPVEYRMRPLESPRVPEPIRFRLGAEMETLGLPHTEHHSEFESTLGHIEKSMVLRNYTPLAVGSLVLLQEILHGSLEADLATRDIQQFPLAKLNDVKHFASR